MIETKTRIFLAIDHPLVRRGLTVFCNNTPDIEVVGEAADGDSAIRSIASTEPDVVIVHAALPLLNGAMMVKELRRTHPKCRTLLLVPLNDAALMKEAMDVGADAYLLTTDLPQHVVRTVRILTMGHRFTCPLLAACSDTILSGSIPDHVRNKLDVKGLHLFSLLTEERTAAKIAQEMDLNRKQVAELRIAMCERLHGVGDSTARMIHPSEMLFLNENEDEESLAS
jgi:DNA-binding NarL/FixJ family response regulator